MKLKISFIVIFFLTVFVAHIKAQKAIFIPEKNNLKLALNGKLEVKKIDFTQSLMLPILSDNVFANQKKSFAEMSQSATINGDYYVQHLGFFCAKEYKFEKATNIPLKFRLGSLDYCNRLEGKR